MNKNKFLYISILFFSILFIGCAKKLPVSTLTIQTQNNNTLTVKAEIAKTQETRNKGFMERKNIPDGTGMLFIFEKDQILSFWMKNTPHPLSIAYIDSNGVIREIFDMKPFSLSPIDSSSSVRYALEVPQGWFKKNNIYPGDKLLLNF